MNNQQYRKFLKRAIQLIASHSKSLGSDLFWMNKTSEQSNLKLKTRKQCQGIKYILGL